MSEPTPNKPTEPPQSPDAAKLDVESFLNNLPPLEEAPPVELSLADQLAAAQAETAQFKDQYMRALAEQDNIRKRGQTEVAAMRDYAAKNFATDLLSVRDTLEAVLADQVSTPEQLKMGVDMTLKQLASAFERHKIKAIEPKGQKFDPNQHQAMMQLESDEPEGTVVQVMQKGYVMGERVLRPAMVGVAKSKAADAAPSA